MEQERSLPFDFQKCCGFFGFFFFEDVNNDRMAWRSGGKVVIVAKLCLNTSWKKNPKTLHWVFCSTIILLTDSTENHLHFRLISFSSLSEFHTYREKQRKGLGDCIISNVFSEKSFFLHFSFHMHFTFHLNAVGEPRNLRRLKEREIYNKTFTDRGSRP